MKKLALTFLFSLSLILSSFCDNVRNIQDNYELIYHINDTTGTPVTGQTVTLTIKKISNGYYYDFSDDTFKASGWSAQTTTLSEEATGKYYYYDFNPPASETAAEQYVFTVSNADETYKDNRSEVVSYQDIGSSDLTDALVWASGTRTLTAGTKDSEIDAILEDTGTTLPGLLSTIQTDLDNTDQYKATGFSTLTAQEVWESTYGIAYSLNGSVDSATVSTIVDAGFSGKSNDYFIGFVIQMTSGNANGEYKEIIDWDDATDTFTVYPHFTVAPTVGDTFKILYGKPTIVVPSRN